MSESNISGERSLSMQIHRKEIDSLSPYIPGKPINEVKNQLGLDIVVKLASNENPYGLSEHAKTAATAAIADASLYPDGSCNDLRHAVANFYNVSPAQLLFGCGTDEVISLIAKTYINPGDEAITACTTFSQYAAAVNSMGGITIYTPMQNHTFDPNAIINSITEKTKLIFIANPNNPTGTTISHAQQIELARRTPKNVLLIIDEAYAEYVDDADYPNTLSMLENFPNMMLLKTFSKGYGLAGLRVGYAIANSDVVSLIERIRNPFNVPHPAQMAAIAAIKDQHFITETKRKNIAVRNFMYEELAKRNLEYIPTQTNFIMIDIKCNSTTAFNVLMAKGYIIRPGSAFGMDNMLRVSLGTMDEMKGFLIALDEIL